MRPILFLPILLAAAACGDGTEPSAPPAERPAAAAPASPAAPAVDALLPDQVSAADLGGELGCSFAESGRPAPLLVATGMVDDPQGTAQALGGGDGAPRRLRAVERGGFDGLLNGGEFDGEGFRFAVRMLPGPPQGEGESPPRPAELVVTAPWGTRRVVQGAWTCGP